MNLRRANVLPVACPAVPAPRVATTGRATSSARCVLRGPASMRRAVHSAMRGNGRDKFQVLDPVVVLHMIDVVDDLSSEKRSTEMPGHDVSVLKNVGPTDTQQNVAATVGHAPSFPVRRLRGRLTDMPHEPRGAFLRCCVPARVRAKLLGRTHPANDAKATFTKGTCVHTEQSSTTSALWKGATWP